MDIATVFINGRLTRDPEAHDVGVVKFSLACNGWKKKDGTAPVSFFDCEAWKGLGETVMNWCTKGKQVSITGTIRIDRWEDNEGNVRSKPVITVRDLQLLGGNKEETPKVEKTKTTPKQEIVNDDLPF